MTVEVWLVLDEGHEEDLTDGGADGADTSYSFKRLPAERAGGLDLALTAAAVVMAWTGAAAAAASATLWLVRRLKRGVVVDARHSPVQVTTHAALHPGQVVIVDGDGKVGVYQEDAAGGAIRAAMTALGDSS